MILDGILRYYTSGLFGICPLTPRLCLAGRSEGSTADVEILVYRMDSCHTVQLKAFAGYL